MKSTPSAMIAAVLVVASAQIAFAGDTNRVDLGAEVKSATVQLEEKFKTVKTTAEELAPNLTAINTLIVKHQKDEDREQVARLYLLVARIHADALDNSQRAMAIFDHVKREFAGTRAASDANVRANQLRAKLAAEETATPEGLEMGMKFPNFNETDVAGKPLSVSNYRGRVLLVDFWATWCGPCVAELPNVIATYRKHQPAGFEIVGISLDSDRDKLMSFTRRSGMTWPQFFDGGGWDNKLANKYGVHSIPATYLLDRKGKIIGKDLRGHDLETAVARALTKK